MAVSEERREQCRQASLSRPPEQRKADAKKAAAASVKSRFGEDNELKQIEKLEMAVDTMRGPGHDPCAPDPVKIFSLVGLGPVQIAKIIKKLIDKSKSDQVRIRACELVCKIHRLLAETPQQQGGITVVIQALEGPQQVNIQGQPPGQAPTHPDPFTHPDPSNPGEPLVITK
ncbi:MAG: hypothetical protein ACLP7A_11525 [Desulfobaccales bacterium]